MSRCLRSPVEAGSIPYSAVTQPRPLPAIQRGTLSCAEAVQITRVSPDRDQRRAGGGAHEPRLDRRSGAVLRRARCALVSRPCAAALTPRASTPSPPARTCSTGPSGICRKRVPSSRNASTSPVHRKLYSPSPSASRVAQLARAERVLDLARERRPGADERHLRAEHPLQHRADQRVVGAAEDHRVHARLPQRRARLAHARHGPLVELLAGLDDRRQRRARHRVQRHVRIDRRDGPLVGAAGHRRRRRQQADPPVARGGHRPQRLGPHDAEHVHAQRRLHHPRAAGSAARRRWRSCRRPPAASRGGRSSSSAISAEKRSSSSRRALAVGEAGGVAEVDEVLARQPHEQLVQHGQTAHARVEHADRPARAGRWPASRWHAVGQCAASWRAIIPERYGQRIVRALVVSNMLPDAAHPERGRFVRDQVDGAARRLEGVDVELLRVPARRRARSRTRARELRRRYRRASGFDVVHAHFGLTAWPALAVHARVRALTVHGTDCAIPARAADPRGAAADGPARRRLRAAARRNCPGRAARRRAQVLPCGVDIERFRPMPARAGARRARARCRQRPFLLFPADPRAPEKRYDRALALAAGRGRRAADARRRRPAAGAAVGQRRQRRARALRARGLRPGRARGARLRRARARHAGRHPSARRCAASRARCARRSSSDAGAARWSRTCASATRGWRGARTPSRFSARRMAERVAAAWRAALAGAGRADALDSMGRSWSQPAWVSDWERSRPRCGPHDARSTRRAVRGGSRRPSPGERRSQPAEPHGSRVAGESADAARVRRARAHAPARALPAQGARARLPRPRRAGLQPAPLRPAQRRAGARQARTLGAHRRRAARARSRAGRAPSR